MLVEDVLLDRRPDATERLVDHGESLKSAGVGAVVNEKKAEDGATARSKNGSPTRSSRGSTPSSISIRRKLAPSWVAHFRH